VINLTFGDAEHHVGRFSDQLLSDAQVGRVSLGENVGG